MGRLLAIDYGTKRTGIAVTDEMQIIASGLTTVETSNLIVFLKTYISKEKVDAKSHRAKGKANDIIHTLDESFTLKNSDKRLQWVQNQIGRASSRERV